MKVFSQDQLTHWPRTSSVTSPSGTGWKEDPSSQLGVGMSQGHRDDEEGTGVQPGSLHSPPLSEKGKLAGEQESCAMLTRHSPRARACRLMGIISDLSFLVDAALSQRLLFPAAGTRDNQHAGCPEDREWQYLGMFVKRKPSSPSQPSRFFPNQTQL